MSENRIKLPEELVKIMNKLPWNFPPSPNLPDLLVEQSGFQKIVEGGIETCKEFLNTIQDIDEQIEKNIPGITSFYLLTSEGKKQSGTLYAITTSGNVINTGNTLDCGRERHFGAMPIPDSGQSQSHITDSDLKLELEKTIFEKVGNIMLYKGRKLDQEEIISFYTAMIALEKATDLTTDTNQCLSILGSMQLTLDVGKLYGKSIETVFFDGHSMPLMTETTPRDLLPVQQLYPVFAKVFMMRAILERLR